MGQTLNFYELSNCCFPLPNRLFGQEANSYKEFGNQEDSLCWTDL